MSIAKTVVKITELPKMRLADISNLCQGVSVERLALWQQESDAYGYTGKPKLWQEGFDKGFKEGSHDLNDTSALNDKLSAILTDTANALKGEPNARISHSWHDLASVSVKLVADNYAKQAKIDALMFEYCPDEMTKEQIAELSKNQNPVNDETTDAINRAINNYD